MGIFWRTVGVSSNFCTGLGSDQGHTGQKQSTKPLPRSGGLLLASAVCTVQAPPQGSPQASRLLSVVLWAGCSWVRCLRGVWRRRIVHSGGATARTLCVICEYHVRVTTLEDFQASVQLLPQLRFKPLPLGNLWTRSKGLDHWTTSGALYFRDRGRALLHNLSFLTKNIFRTYFVHFVPIQ